MGQNYYYFAASLPMVFFESPAPFSVEEFLLECERLLSPEDFEKISALLAPQGMNEDFVADIASQMKANPQLADQTFYKTVSFLKRFQNETAFFRAQRANKDPQKYLRGEYYSDPALLAVIQEAAKTDNPLETEKELDRARWQILDDLVSAHSFDFESILVYGLKLKILNKYKQINSPVGRETLESFKKIEIS